MLAGCGQKGPLYLAEEPDQPGQELVEPESTKQRKQGLKTGTYQGGFALER